MMQACFQIVLRDLRLALRQGLDAVMVLMFFVITVTLFPLGVGPEPNLLARMAPGVIWVAAFFQPCCRSTDCFSTTTKTVHWSKCCSHRCRLRPWFCRRWLRIGSNRTATDRGLAPPRRIHEYAGGRVRCAYIEPPSRNTCREFDWCGWRRPYLGCAARRGSYFACWCCRFIYRF